MKLIHGDCLEEMKRLPDRSIDLFLCDLPYGCLTNQPLKDGTPGESKGGKHYSAKPGGGCVATKRREAGEGGMFGCSWDIKIDLEKFWEQVERLMKDDHTPIIHFCNTKFGYELIKSKEKWFRYDLVWNKMRGVGFLSANKMPMRSHELIYVFSKKGARYNRIDISGEPYHKKSKEHICENYNVKRTEGHNEGTRCVLSVIECFNKAGHSGGKHPTQKPDDLYKWLIERYSNPGDTILDPTAGSFASCLTANALGRQAIGIEKDDKFYEKALSLVKE